MYDDITLQLYKDKVEERRAIREMYRQQTLIFTSGPFPDRHPPLNPYLPRYDPFGVFHPGPPMPRFIGGEYDLRPNFPGEFTSCLKAKIKAMCSDTHQYSTL